MLPSIKSIERLRTIPEPIPQRTKKYNDFTTKSLRLRNEPFQKPHEPNAILYWETEMDHLVPFDQKY